MWSYGLNQTRINISGRFSKYGKCWIPAAGKKPGIKNRAYPAYNQRVEHYVNYCMGTITCARCERTLRVVHSSSTRLEFGSWNFDHVLGKEAVKKVAIDLFAKGLQVNKAKYFDLLWGDNLVLVCMSCHSKLKRTEADKDKIKEILLS